MKSLLDQKLGPSSQSLTWNLNMKSKLDRKFKKLDLRFEYIKSKLKDLKSKLDEQKLRECCLQWWWKTTCPSAGVIDTFLEA